MQRHSRRKIVLLMGTLMSSLGSSLLYSVSYSHLYHAHESSWIFLEELIIKEPQRQIDAPLGTGGALIAGSLVTGIFSYKVISYLTGTTSKLGKVSLGLLGFVAGFFQHYELRKRLLRKAEHSQIISIMKMWSHLRDKLPFEIWSCLDKLHTQWNSDKKSFNANLDTSITYLKSEIYGRFPSKYGESTSSFFSRNNVHVKLSLDVYKSIKGFLGTVKELLA